LRQLHASLGLLLAPASTTSPKLVCTHQVLLWTMLLVHFLYQVVGLPLPATPLFANPLN
jgi:hypothetical protein